MPAPTRRPPPRFGPEPWREIAGCEWSHWDLWFCVVARREHHGDVGSFSASLAERLRQGGLLSGTDGEQRLSHVVDLQSRLADADLSAADLADDDVLADPKIVRRAKDKVGGRNIDGRSMTPAMNRTPRRVLHDRARRGHWPLFPSDPTTFYERFRPQVERKGDITDDQLFRIVGLLTNRLADLDGPRRSLPDRLALYRAFHTAGLELADRVIDHFGVVGQTRREAWREYLEIDWRGSGIEPAAYWQDLCELRVWEPYAIDHEVRSAWFASATPSDVDLIEAILLDLENELRSQVLDYEADEAVEALADLYVATRSRDRYVDAARRLGSRSWMPIMAMVDSLLATRSTEAALAVLRAADQPGRGRSILRRMCRDRTGIDLAATGPANEDHVNDDAGERTSVDRAADAPSPP